MFYIEKERWFLSGQDLSSQNKNNPSGFGPSKITFLIVPGFRYIVVSISLNLSEHRYNLIILSTFSI